MVPGSECGGSQLLPSSCFEVSRVKTSLTFPLLPWAARVVHPKSCFLNSWSSTSSISIAVRMVAAVTRFLLVHDMLPSLCIFPVCLCA